MRSQFDAMLRHRCTGPAATALIGIIAVLATLDGAGRWPTLPGPGITSDETIYVPQAKRMVWALTHLGPLFFDREWVEQIFGPSPDHPPLGRWLIGLMHRLGDPHPERLDEFCITAARPAAAVAYGALIFAVGLMAGRLAGPGAGWLAALAALLMPRLFAHAHLAVLDTFMALFYCASLASFHWALLQPRRGGRALLAGFVTGLALLTKIHALLLPIIMVPWALVFWRTRALKPLAIWAAAAIATFLLGWPWIWPWLWDSPETAMEHLRQWIAGATDRAPIRVWYLGQAVPDSAIPFHYPWLMFLVTVPIGLHLLGAVGVIHLGRRTWSEPGWALLAMGGIAVLILFSIPGVVVYDGARLFLMVYPLWSVFVGVGVITVFDWLRRQRHGLRLRPKLASAALGIFLLVQAAGQWEFHPFQLSYYNLIVGGLRGADRLGLEVTYWGDSIDRHAIEELTKWVPPGSHVRLAPNLHPFQAEGLMKESLLLQQNRLVLVGDSSASLSRPQHPTPQCQWLLVYNRKAYLAPVREILKNNNLVWTQRRQGVWLAAIYRLEPPN